MNILSFGEILWDIINDKSYIGGAPFNLATHLAKRWDVNQLLFLLWVKMLWAEKP